MTEEGAKLVLRDYRVVVSGFRDCREAIDIATKALEKQIAKKPIDKLMYIECPACGDVGIEDCAYCPVCGQKLDWSEV